MSKTLFFIMLMLSLVVLAFGQVEEDFEVTPFDFWIPSAGNDSPSPSLNAVYDHTFIPENTSGHSAYMERNLIERNAASGYLTSMYMQVIPTSISMWVYNDSPTPGWGSSYVYVETSPDGVTWTPAGDFHNGNINTWEPLTVTVLPDANAHYVRIFVRSNKEGMWYLDDITMDGGVLPVELSSFTAMLSVDNFVNLIWVTQSETNVQGYYVLRGGNAELSSAAVISPLISATNTSQQQTYIYKDTEIPGNGTYFYWLQDSEMDGSSNYFGPVRVDYFTASGGNPDIPRFTRLGNVYPNPFNPVAYIPYSVADEAEVGIRVFNARGQAVRDFQLGSKQPGNHTLIWDGRDATGRECPTGVYYLRLTAGPVIQTQKAVLAK